MIREDWVETELDKACDICDHLRKPINSKERTKRIEGKKTSDLYPYYGATGQVGFIDDYLTDGEYVLMGENGAPFFDYTKDIAYMINGKTWVNNHAHILLSKFNNKFLLHYLNQFNFNGFVSGTTRLKLTQSSLNRIPIKLAPIPEQRAIVAKIEKLFSDLDNGIANLKAAKAKLGIYRQAVLKKAFEGELTKEWREKQIKNAEWQNVSVKQISENIQYGYTESSSTKKIGPKFLRITDIQYNVVNWLAVPYCKIEDSLKRKYLLKDGDLVFARTGATVGKSFLIKGAIPEAVYASYLIRIRFLKTISDKYVWYFFQSPFYWGQIKSKQVGTGQPNVNGTKLGEIKVPVCSIQEQAQIVMEIESRFSVCDKLAESIDQSLEKAEALRQSILKKAFAGKLLSETELAACRRDPDWEPAAKLLERIQKDKSGRSAIKQVKNR